MKKIWVIATLIGTFILLAVVFFILILLPAAADEAVAGKYCNTGTPSIMVFRCENSTYLVTPINPDLGSTYTDSSGNKIATCGGFINVHPPECPALEALSCNRTANICDSHPG